MGNVGSMEEALRQVFSVGPAYITLPQVHPSPLSAAGRWEGKRYNCLVFSPGWSLLLALPSPLSSPCPSPPCCPLQPLLPSDLHQPHSHGFLNIPLASSGRTGLAVSMLVQGSALGSALQGSCLAKLARKDLNSNVKRTFRGSRALSLNQLGRLAEASKLSRERNVS